MEMADLLKSKRLREDRAPVAQQIRDMADKAVGENRDFSAEEQGQWEKLNADYNALTRAIAISERAEHVAVDIDTLREDRSADMKPARTPGRGDFTASTGEDDEPESRDRGPSEEDRAFALQAWLRSGAGKDLEKRHVEACAKVGVRPHGQNYDFDLRRDMSKVRAEFRDQSSVSGPAGQYTVPTGFVNNLEMALLAYGGMRQVAEVMRTSSGNNMPWPTTNDTSNEGAIIAENTAVSEQDITFGQVVFYAHKYSSKLIQVPVELLEDSAFDLASEIGRILGERLGRITNRHFTVGTGAGQPEGIVPGSTLGVTTASGTAITADELLGLVHSVDPSYRTAAGFMMHDNIMLHIRKLKDGQGQFLWSSGLNAGMADRLCGYPITVNQHMQSAVETGTKTVIFGQLSKYKIRDVAGVRLVRLNERYADYDQVGFLAFSRHDGHLLDAGVAPVKHILQA
jgi:HK97 family phage major capsid protein